MRCTTSQGFKKEKERKKKEKERKKKEKKRKKKDVREVFIFSFLGNYLQSMKKLSYLNKK